MVKYLHRRRGTPFVPCARAERAARCCHKSAGRSEGPCCTTALPTPPHGPVPVTEQARHTCRLCMQYTHIYACTHVRTHSTHARAHNMCTQRHRHRHTQTQTQAHTDTHTQHVHTQTQTRMQHTHARKHAHTQNLYSNYF